DRPAFDGRADRRGDHRHAGEEAEVNQGQRHGTGLQPGTSLAPLILCPPLSEIFSNHLPAPAGPRRIAGGKLALGERGPRIGTQKCRSAPEGRRNNNDEPDAPVLAFARFFPRPSGAKNPWASQPGGGARRLACPRLLSWAPLGPTKFPT